MEYQAIKPVNEDLLYISGSYPVCTTSEYQWRLDSITYEEKDSHLVQVKFSKKEGTMTRHYPIFSVEYLATCSKTSSERKETDNCKIE